MKRSPSEGVPKGIPAAMALAQTVPKEPRLSTLRLLQSNSENGFNNRTC